VIASFKKSVAVVLGGLLAVSLGATQARAISLGADDPAEVAFKAGSFDGINGHHPAALFGAEYRFAQTFYSIRPLVGATVTSKGATYAFGGFGIDVTICPKIILTPNAAVGVFQHGNGTRLGSWVEFRTGAELDYRFDDKSRLGITFHHISNAGFTHQNPGEEEVGVVYALPIGLVLP
jgi:lipid A 3-O-deacylase